MPVLIPVVGLKELHLDASVENFAYELIRLYAVTEIGMGGDVLSLGIPYVAAMRIYVKHT